MVSNAHPTVGSSSPTYLKVANYPGLYRHARSGRYYGVKKLAGRRRERSLGTCDRKIAERRLKEWLDAACGRASSYGSGRRAWTRS